MNHPHHKQKRILDAFFLQRLDELYHRFFACDGLSCHLLYQKVEQLLGLVVNFCKTAAQYATGQQIDIESWTIFLDVPQMLSASYSDGLGVHFFQHQTRDVIVALEFVP